MVQTFTCAACGISQRGGSPYKVTGANLPAVIILFATAGLAGRENLCEGVQLCTQARQYRGRNGKGPTVTAPPCIGASVRQALGSLLVGQSVSRIFAGTNGPEFVDGTIVRVSSEPPTMRGGELVIPASIQYEAVYDKAPGGPTSVTYSQAEAQEAVDAYRALQKRINAAVQKERDAAGARGRRAAAAAANVRSDASESGGSDDADVERAVRGLRWPEVIDPAWWATWGDKVSPTFHTSLFGFPTPSSMRDFFEAFFEDESLERDPFPGGLTSTRLSTYEVFALSLMRARTGWKVQFLAALVGVDRSGLGSVTGHWIKYKLGPVGRFLIGVPHVEYLLESVPNSFRDCNMGKCVAVGDASDYMTETPRTPFMKKVRNMMWSDKVHHSAARGGSFCSGNGMNIAVLDLVFARASETAIIRAMVHMLASLPPFVHLAYDKGVRGMRSLLPNCNFVFMPCFLAPSKGKTQFTASEVAHSPRPMLWCCPRPRQPVILGNPRARCGAQPLRCRDHVQAVEGVASSEGGGGERELLPHERGLAVVHGLLQPLPRVPPAATGRGDVGAARAAAQARRPGAGGGTGGAGGVA